MQQSFLHPDIVEARKHRQLMLEVESLIRKNGLKLPDVFDGIGMSRNLRISHPCVTSHNLSKMKRWIKRLKDRELCACN